MADDKSKQGYQDDSKIAKDELYYWSEKWGVSEEAIMHAKQSTGSDAVSVIRQFLIDNELMCGN